MRGLAALFVLAFFAGCVSLPSNPGSPGAAHVSTLASGSFQFSAPVTVDANRIASEPSIKVSANGTIFISAPTGNVKYATRPQDLVVEAPQGPFQSAVWRSVDGGKTFQFLSLGAVPYHGPEPGGGDSDLAIDGSGTVYLVDQIGLLGETTEASPDNGTSWTVGTPVGAGSVGADRAWLFADPTAPGTVYMAYDHLPVSIDVAKTTDGGQTWTATAAAGNSTDTGPIVVSHGTIAFSYRASDGLRFVKSTDGGQTWVEAPVGIGNRSLSPGFPQTFVDRAGTFYVAWLQDNGIAYTFSKDSGKSWSPTSLLVPLNSTHIYLWAVAGDAGKIGFAWFDTNDPQGNWYVHAAIARGADTSAPQYVTTVVDTNPARVGPPCTMGVACTSGRELGDFLQVAVTPGGDLVTSYVHVISAQSGGRITFSRETGGPRLLSSPLTPWDN